MTDKEKTTFTVREVTEMLIKHARIHEGIWGPVFEFGLAAANVPVAGPNNEFSLRPTGMVSILQIGIKRFDEPNPLTVDAEKVNPVRSDPRPRAETKKTPSI